MEQFVKLQEIIREKKLAGVRIYAISPDPVEKLRDMAAKVAAKTGASFDSVVLLSDADHQVIDAWGLLNQEAAARGRFLPHPATFVIDRKGVVRWSFIEKDYKIRPSNEMVLDAIRESR